MIYIMGNSFFPESQHYVNPLLLFEKPELIDFLIGYGIFMFVLIVSSLLYSTYFSYPSIPNQLCISLCGMKPTRVWRRRMLKSSLYAGAHQEYELSPLSYTPLSPPHHSIVAKRNNDIDPSPSSSLSPMSPVPRPANVNVNSPK